MGDSRFRVGVGDRIGFRAMVRAMVWARLRGRVMVGVTVAFLVLVHLVSVPACIDAISS